MILKVSASMLEHQSSPDLVRQARSKPGAAEISFRAVVPAKGYLLLQSRSGSNLQDALASETGLELPPPGEARILGDYALLWLTPAEWLLEMPAKDVHSLQLAVAGGLGDSLAAVTDMSDALGCCEVSGARAAEVLMSGCSLDLNAHAFPPGRVARTVLADIPVIIWNLDQPERFRCLIDRSFGGHFGDWLSEAARE
jgi:heterotetrameric sarcosine oxidase gamma subunit